MDTLLDLFEASVTRFGDRNAVGLRTDDGTTWHWSFRELDRRSRLAAWRLRALGLEPGDRLLTWSPSTPALPAVYFGAMRARLVLVPLDLRMSSDAIENIVRKSAAKQLVLGTGRDAPDPRDAKLERFPTTTVDALTADPDDAFPPDWEAQLAAWERPRPDEIWELIFTSGTTGTPKGVMLAHDNIVAGVQSFHTIVPGMDHRIVSLLPLSHLLEQAVGLFYALDVGADILYLRSVNPRVIFESLREHRVTSMVVVPQVLDLFWSAIEREVEKSGRARQFAWLRGIARRLPMGLRRVVFRSVHQRLGGGFRLFISAGAFLPPALQQAWEDLGVTVLQGYGSTETASGACTTLDDHGLGTVGRPVSGMEVRIAADGEIQFRGPTLFKGYWDEPGADRSRVHRGRLVQERRHRPLRRRRQADPVRAQEGHHRPAQRLQRVPGGHRERAADGRHPGIRGARDVTGADRGGDPARRPEGGPGRGAGPHRGGGQGREHDPRPKPARGRLAGVARRGLPAHAHAQGQAGPGAQMGRRGIGAAGERGQRRARPTGRRRTSCRSCEAPPRRAARPRPGPRPAPSRTR